MQFSAGALDQQRERGREREKERERETERQGGRIEREREQGRRKRDINFIKQYDGIAPEEVEGHQLTQ